MTFAEIHARARAGDSRERSGRRTLQGMVSYGVLIVTSSGGKGDPFHYSITHSFARTQAPARRARTAPPL
jgi:hypothetical protein